MASSSRYRRAWLIVLSNRLRGAAPNAARHGLFLGDSHDVSSIIWPVASDPALRMGDNVLMATADRADLSRITVVPGQRSGQPCIRGLRVTVWDVLDMLASGMTEDEILRDYPYLEKADFPAVYAYAAYSGRARVSR